MIAMPTDAEPVTVVEGDCLEVLRGLPDGCVDAVVTDPPYPGIQREYGYWTEAEWFALMDPLVEQCRRVLKPDGSAVFVLQANSERVGRMRTWLWEFMAKWGKEWGVVQDAYWWNHAQPPTVHTHRDIGLMRPSLKACVWLGGSGCYRNQDEVLTEPAASTVADKRVNDNTLRRQPSGYTTRHARRLSVFRDRGGVTPFNVFVCANSDAVNGAGSEGHGAGTPASLVRWWVRYICPPNGTILDPFLGSGTVALVALTEGRRCVGIERHPPYADICRRRVAEAMGLGKGSLLATLPAASLFGGVE